MVSFLEAVRDGIRATQCGLLGFDEFVLGGVGRLSPGLRDVGLRTVNAYRRILGCDPDDDPVADPPFFGGQCPGAGYTVTISNGNSTATRNAVGPITGVCFGDQPPPQNVTWGVQSAQGCILSGGGTATIPPSTRPNVRIINVVRNGGVPDDCGDPDVEYPDPSPRPIDIDITFQPDFGPEITVPITINYSPFEVNFNGDVRFPFNFNFGGVNFNGDVSFNPDLNVNINPPRLPPGGGEDLQPVGDDEPGDTVPPAPPEQKIIGVVVNVSDTNSDRVSSYSSPNIPPIFAPRLGSVKFAYSIGAATFWSSDIDIKGDRTFIECPFSQGADAVVASPQTGVSLTFVPIRGFPLATIGDIPTPT